MPSSRTPFLLAPTPPSLAEAEAAARARHEARVKLADEIAAARVRAFEVYGQTDKSGIYLAYVRSERDGRPLCNLNLAAHRSAPGPSVRASTWDEVFEITAAWYEAQKPAKKKGFLKKKPDRHAGLRSALRRSRRSHVACTFHPPKADGSGNSHPGTQWADEALGAEPV